MLSQRFKTLLGKDIWASSADAATALPEDVGLTREDGWGIAYEQKGSGKFPERTVWNRLFLEITAALRDIADYGGPILWNAEVNYSPTGGDAAFALTATGLHRTFTPTGPNTGNPVDPDSPGQTVWSKF